MVAVSPITLPDGVADCTVSKGTPALKDCFVRLYASHLGKNKGRGNLPAFVLQCCMPVI